MPLMQSFCKEKLNLAPAAGVIRMQSEFQVTLGPKETKVLYYAVSEALRMWPGAPQRPYEEQILLSELKNILFAMTMDILLEEGSDKTEY